MIHDMQARAYLDALPVGERAAWKQRLERLRNDCGCGVGSIFTLAITASWIAHSIFNPVAGQTWQHKVWIGVGVLLASGVVGKLLGLVVARVRFQMAAQELRRVVAALEKVPAAPASREVGAAGCSYGNTPC